MIDRTKLGISTGFTIKLSYDLVIQTLKVLRLDYFTNKSIKSRNAHNNIVISTGIGVAL